MTLIDLGTLHRLPLPPAPADLGVVSTPLAVLCPFCRRPVAGLLALCREPDCLRLEIAADVAMERLADQ